MEAHYFKINTMLFIYPKHKEITKDISVMVSLYLQICYDLFFEDEISWRAMDYMQVLGSDGQDKPKQLYK